MLQRLKAVTASSIALVLSVGIGNIAYADVSDQLLIDINSGERAPIRDPIRLKLLKDVPVPEPSNLAEFVKDKRAAIKLGKALFWDMQVGSDGVQACASCHFNAGADSRVKNQLSPGLLNANQNATLNPDKTFASGKGPNFTLSTADFPFHQKADPLNFKSATVSDTNDVNSSQGVHFSLFVNASTGNAVDQVDLASEPDGFLVSGTNTRRVEPRHTPTVINAVFNHRQFWDGRANNIFNGVSSFGDSDPDALVFIADPATKSVKQIRVSIDNASLASQAVGPPLSEFEASSKGRVWHEIGDKFIKNALGEDGERPLRPLAKQKVHRSDSVLGRLSRDRKPGLIVNSYAPMIRDAFVDKWWNAEEYIRIPDNKPATNANVTFISPEEAALGGEDVYSQMEMNFSLFFGLAVQLYQATLVSDDSPVDRYLAGDTTALTDSQLVGFHLADVEGRCLNCHGNAEFTFAGVSRILHDDFNLGPDPDPTVEPDFGVTRIRGNNLIDEGFNNIGVRTTLEDLGVGGLDPFGNPLSIARKVHLGLAPGTGADRAAILGADGAVKIPTLRNVELTAPYLHNGSVANLVDVVEFYFRGGNFRSLDEDGTAHTHPIIGFDASRTNPVDIDGLGILTGEHQNSRRGLNTAPDSLGTVDRDNIVAFLKALTDERVRFERAPFDHPQLFIPNGHPGDNTSVTADGSGNATDKFIVIPAVGRNGRNKPQPTYADNLGAGVNGSGDGDGDGDGGGGGGKPCKGKRC